MNENKYLITGGLGFIGFNFIQYLVEDIKINPNNIVCLDCITYAAKYMLDKKINYLNKYNIYFYTYDFVKDIGVIENLIKKDNITHIIHFGAESHVDNSLNNPNLFTEVNVIGTQNLLNLAKKYNLRFHQIGTDEVYGSVDPEKDIVDETFKLNPSSPYSASKTAADLMCVAYYKSFGTKVTVSRCSNNFGPWQHPEKMLPKMITNVLQEKKIPVYGNGMQRRFWIYVKEHNEAVWKILNNGKYGEIYNIAPETNNLITNIELINRTLNILGKNPADYIEYVKDRPGHDLCYYLIGTKIFNDCGHKYSVGKFNEQLKETIEWYKIYLKN